MSDPAWYRDPDGRWRDDGVGPERSWPPLDMGVPLLAPPGWYDDPHDSSTVRWWNGRRWTDRLARIEVGRGPASEIGRGRPTVIAVAAVGATLALGIALVVLS